MTVCLSFTGFDFYLPGAFEFSGVVVVMYFWSAAFPHPMCMPVRLSKMAS